MSLSLSVASSDGNNSAPTYGLLYEDGWHSGDGGLYGELIRNRAFQGSEINGGPSLTRSTQFWTAFGGATISIDTTTPVLSSQLSYQMRMDVPASLTGPVGFYNTGFYGMRVDATKNYTASMYMRGTYNGVISAEFQNYVSGEILSHTQVKVNQKVKGFKQIVFPQFFPNQSATNPNNTFAFIFDGAQLAGKSLYFNLLSVFPKTFNNRANGLREDMVQAVIDLGLENIRLPGGNNLEGVRSPFLWEWSDTIGPLTQRPGRPGTWSDIDTEGFGLLEQVQWTLDMNVSAQLGAWAGLYLDGEIVAESGLGAYVTDTLNELQFLMGSKTTKYGKLRNQYGYPDPFNNIQEVEIGNEDFLNGGYNSYYSYRFNMFSSAIKAAYPKLRQISTIFPPPSGLWPSDLHYYSNEDFFVSLFNAWDNSNRSLPLYISEYGTQNVYNYGGEIGQTTISMACAEAIFLMGCERNADVCLGTAHGVFTKSYDENPGTLSLIKHTADQILKSMSYYVVQLFAHNNGVSTLPVTSTGGGLNPVYWSAQKNGTNTILKLVNHNGPANTIIPVTFQNSDANTATIITMTAPDNSRGNSLPQLGGEWNTITRTVVAGSAGGFNISFTQPYEIKILVV